MRRRRRHEPPGHQPSAGRLFPDHRRCATGRWDAATTTMRQRSRVRRRASRPAQRADAQGDSATRTPHRSISGSRNPMRSPARGRADSTKSPRCPSASPRNQLGSSCIASGKPAAATLKSWPESSKLTRCMLAARKRTSLGAAKCDDVDICRDNC